MSSASSGCVMAGKDNSHEKLLGAAEKVWSMLDQLAESNPEEYKKFIEQQLKEGAQSVSPPEPGFCLSCSATLRRTRHKLFINVCKWVQIPGPTSDTDPIPVKGGVLRHLVKNGHKTEHLLIDIAFNSYVIKECCKRYELEQLLIGLSLDFVSDFTKLLVDKQSYKKLKVAFKGAKEDMGHSLDERLNHLLPKESHMDIGESILDELHRMSVSEDKKSEGEKLPPLKLFPSHKRVPPGHKLIEELPSTHSGCESGRVKQPEYCVETVREEEKEMVKIIVQLPGVSGVKEVLVDVSEEDMCVEVPNKYSLVVKLPCLVDEDTVKAKFVSNKTELIVTATPQ